MELRQMNLFKLMWECTSCGKLFVNGEGGEVFTYAPFNSKYNATLDRKN